MTTCYVSMSSQKLVKDVLQWHLLRFDPIFCVLSLPDHAFPVQLASCLWLGRRSPFRLRVCAPMGPRVQNLMCQPLVTNCADSTFVVWTISTYSLSDWDHGQGFRTRSHRHGMHTTSFPSSPRLSSISVLHELQGLGTPTVCREECEDNRRFHWQDILYLH